VLDLVLSIYVLKGLSPWVIQRISSVFVALFILYAFVSLFSATIFSYQAWMVWLFCPLNIILVALFAIALLFHSWIGLRDVVLDYIHHFMLRILFLTMIAGTLMSCGIWVAKILLLTTVQ
jgi:succinate dehydrogenase / fumarate reductase membrane anchor subunit